MTTKKTQQTQQTQQPRTQQLRADDGWTDASPRTQEAARWLTKLDWTARDKDGLFVEGYVWQGRIVDAFLTEGEKGYNAALAFQLTQAPHPDCATRKVKVSGQLVEVTIDVGDVVAFSEKGEMRQSRTFRDMRVGDEFRMRVVSEKDTGKPSPMQNFEVRRRAGNVKDAKTVQQLLDASYQARTAAGGDAWTQTGPGIGAMPPEDAPF